MCYYVGDHLYPPGPSQVIEMTTYSVAISTAWWRTLGDAMASTENFRDSRDSRGVQTSYFTLDGDTDGLSYYSWYPQNSLQKPLHLNKLARL